MVVLSITPRRIPGWRPRGDTKQASVRSQAGLPQWRRSKLALTGDPWLWKNKGAAPNTDRTQPDLIRRKFDIAYFREESPRRRTECHSFRAVILRTLWTSAKTLYNLKRLLLGFIKQAQFRFCDIKEWARVFFSALYFICVCRSCAFRTRYFGKRKASNWSWISGQ